MDTSPQNNQDLTQICIYVTMEASETAFKLPQSTKQKLNPISPKLR